MLHVDSVVVNKCHHQSQPHPSPLGPGDLSDQDGGLDHHGTVTA